MNINRRFETYVDSFFIPAQIHLWPVNNEACEGNKLGKLAFE